MRFTETMELVGKAVDGAGVVVIVLGLLLAAGRYGLRLLRSSAPEESYRQLRRSLGRSILIGLELLVAGDIIRTVAVEPTFTSVGVLAGIVAIRTFLSFTLEVEIGGRWPWQADRVS